MVKSKTSCGEIKYFLWCVWGWRLYLWVILSLPIRCGLTGKLGYRKDTVLGLLHRTRGWASQILGNGNTPSALLVPLPEGQFNALPPLRCFSLVSLAWGQSFVVCRSW